MSIVHFLYDVFVKSYDQNYADWRSNQALERSKRLQEQANKERREHGKAEEHRQRRALRAEKAAIEEDRRVIERRHETEREKECVGALRQEVWSDPERLARLRQHETECDSLRRQIREKKVGIGQNLDLEELQNKLANAETAVRAERERERLARLQTPPSPAAQPASNANETDASESPMTPHLSEKQMQSMAQKMFVRIGTLPHWEQEETLAEWQEEIESEYGPLVAEELADSVREMLAE